MKRIVYMAHYVWRRVKAVAALHERLYYATETTRVMVTRLDPYTIRAALAVGSVLWAAGQIPWLGIDPFQLHGYEVLRWFGPSWFWAGIFLVHATLVIWRLTRLVQDDAIDRWVNSFGFCLWAFTTLMFNISIHRYSSGTAIEWTMVIMAGFALARSGLVTPPTGVSSGSVVP